MTSRFRCLTQSESCEPPKPRLITTGRSLNWSSRSLQSRIDELPTNNTPPAGRGCVASSAAKAANVASHGMRREAPSQWRAVKSNAAALPQRGAQEQPSGGLDHPVFNQAGGLRSDLVLGQRRRFSNNRYYKRTISVRNPRACEISRTSMDADRHRPSTAWAMGEGWCFPRAGRRESTNGRRHRRDVRQ